MSLTFQQDMQECQSDIKYWLTNQIGEPEQFTSLENRSQRFFEEATELVQATGLTRDQCHKLVDYVFNRPVGEVPQEIGGAIVCLAALAERVNQNVAVCLLRELKRIHQPHMIEKVKDAIERKRRDGVGI